MAPSTQPDPPEGGTPPSSTPSPPEPSSTEPPTVHDLLVAVMRDLPYIAKDQQNTAQRYMFRGVDAVMDAVGPLVRKHGLICLPAQVQIIENERYETRGRDNKPGAPMQGVILAVDWELRGPGGPHDVLSASTFGQAADAGDKAVAKAFSVAYRELWLKLLVVPTGEKDVDEAEPHQRAAAAEENPLLLGQFNDEISAAATVQQLRKVWERVESTRQAGEISVATYGQLARAVQRANERLVQRHTADVEGESGADQTSGSVPTDDVPGRGDDPYS